MSIFKAVLPFVIADALDHKVQGMEMREKIYNEKHDLPPTPAQLRFRCYKDDPFYDDYYPKSKGGISESVLWGIIAIAVFIIGMVNLIG